VARESNLASRGVLSDLGMREVGEFRHQGHRMLQFESVA
jgi:RimJ/RimL family protein N-acetyltransferase